MVDYEPDVVKLWIKAFLPLLPPTCLLCVVIRITGKYNMLLGGRKTRK